MKRLRVRTRKIFKITFQIITGYQPEDYNKCRRENILFLFSRTIHGLKTCEETYDKAYKLYTNHEKAKIHAYEILSI